jgi:dipeptidyl aminopeptidase/acylaminoacyl peptidase
MRWAGIFASALCALLTGAAQGAPLEAYGQLPTLDNVAISPDGKHIAFATDVQGARTVVIDSIDDRKALAGLKTGEQKLRDLSWVDDERLMITMSVTSRAIGITGGRQEYMLSQIYDIKTGETKPLFKRVNNSMNVVLGVPEIRTVDGHARIFAEGYGFDDENGVQTLFSVDPETDDVRIPERRTGGSGDWVLDEHGTVVAITEYDGGRQRWTLKARRGSKFDEIYAVAAPIETPAVLGIGPDGKSLMIQEVKDGTVKQSQFNIETGAAETPLDLGDGFAGIVVDPITHRIIGSRQMGDSVSYVFFDPEDQAAWHSVTQAFPGEEVQLVSWSSDRKRVVVRVDGREDGADYQLVDLNTNHATALGRIYSGIDPGDVATVKIIHYAAADGRMIPAYLTLPNGRPAKGLPLIVLPHGGPAARDEPGFDWWAQALASRGYAVLQPEFRGSNGFGWAHLAAGFGEWGHKMQTDLSDGVRFLAADGTIDPKRVCIAGASYGGYAALAGPTLQPGIYRCAVSVAGVSDPRGMLEQERRAAQASDSASQRYWSRFMGVKDFDDAKLSDISPLDHAATADVPILLIHGGDDTVVSFDQSVNMDRALRRAGKQVTFVKLDSEDHWLSKSETRLKMLQAMVTFLETNNPPNSAAMP